MPRLVPKMTTDEEVEAFLDQDLSDLDFSQFKRVHFEFATWDTVETRFKPMTNRNPMTSKKLDARTREMRDAALLSQSEQANAPFTFLVRPATSLDVDCLSLGASFEHHIFLLVQGHQFSSLATCIAIFPKILDPKMFVLPDKFSFKTKDRAIFAMLNVDYESWIAASEVVHVDLLADNIRDSVLKTKEKYLNEIDKKALLEFVEIVRRKLRSGFLN